ncbi:hypothetical protein [Microbacterium sp. XT11]|uniref:hypothetical protein n=1 Tax=Microbacterium sp. XT11 TaxID=367477 RepID=UPI000A80089B|nr:hypothetical protein [Microbacterium sp. XT11]
MEFQFAFVNFLVTVLLIGGLIWFVIALLRRSLRKLVRTEVRAMYGPRAKTPQSNRGTD